MEDIFLATMGALIPIMAEMEDIGLIITVTRMVDTIQEEMGETEDITQEVMEKMEDFIPIIMEETMVEMEDTIQETMVEMAGITPETMVETVDIGLEVEVEISQKNDFMPQDRITMFEDLIYSCL